MKKGQELDWNLLTSAAGESVVSGWVARWYLIRDISAGAGVPRGRMRHCGAVR